jgi:type IX secretion system PorP/SprF family membrane protein
MKKLLFTALLALLFWDASAQREPRWNHYMFNDFSFNPGVAGSRGAISTFLIHRYQWVNIADGSPRTTNLSLHAPVKFLHGGIGFNIVRDQIFVTDFTSLQLSYAYRASVFNGSLGVGVSGGILQTGFQGSRLNPLQTGDVLVPTANTTGLSPDFGFGIHYKDDDMFVHIASNRLNQPSINQLIGFSLYTETFLRNFFVSAGYNIPIGSTFVLTPSFMIRNNASATQFDINAIGTYNGKFWAGLGYSTFDAAMIMVGANVGKNFRVGYSYDYSLGALSGAHAGSHEIFIGYDFNIKFPPKQQITIRSPRFL